MHTREGGVERGTRKRSFRGGRIHVHMHGMTGREGLYGLIDSVDIQRQSASCCEAETGLKDPWSGN